MSENKKQESLANVIADGRSYKGIPVPYAPARALWLDEFNSFLDRIEAAYKRDIEKLNSVIQATVSRSDAEIDRLRREVAELRKQIGDAAAIREALTKVKEWMEHRIATCGFEFSATFPTMLEDVVLPALAKPPRNCDMGTAKEQDERFRDFCPKFVGGTCTCCELRDCGIADCSLAWEQMPYTESEVAHGNA